MDADNLTSKLRNASALLRQDAPDRGKVVIALLDARSEVTSSAALLTAIDGALRDVEAGDLSEIADTLDAAGRKHFIGYDG